MTWQCCSTKSGNFWGCMATSSVAMGLEKGHTEKRAGPLFVSPIQLLLVTITFPSGNAQTEEKTTWQCCSTKSSNFWGCIATSSVARGLEKGHTPVFVSPYTASRVNVYISSRKILKLKMKKTWHGCCNKVVMFGDV